MRPGAPWDGRSALDAVELMDTGWNFRRRTSASAAAFAITSSSTAAISRTWCRPRRVSGTTSAKWITRTFWNRTKLGDTWASRGHDDRYNVHQEAGRIGLAPHFNKVIAEVQQKNIEASACPSGTPLTRLLRSASERDGEAGRRLEGQGRGVEAAFPGNRTGRFGRRWRHFVVVPMVYLRYPANIPHSLATVGRWVAMATPLAHKGSAAGAKVQVLTALDLMLSADTVQKAWNLLQRHNEKTGSTRVDRDRGSPAIEMNREKMERFRPEIEEVHYDS